MPMKLLICLMFVSASAHAVVTIPALAHQVNCIQSAPVKHHKRALPSAHKDTAAPVICPVAHDERPDPEEIPTPIIYYKYLPAPPVDASAPGAPAPTCNSFGTTGGVWGWNKRPAQAPELDPSSLPASLTLLCGALAVLRARK
jgi:hypothetical protein